MPALTDKPVLFLDFDNTITRGDVLDAVIERFSPNERWREWEQSWREGRLSTQECLRQQMANLRLSAPELLDFISTTVIDPYFASIVDWSASEQVQLTIVSDSFSVLIQAILRNNGVKAVPVLANELVFSGDRVEAIFPYRDPSCPRCAHCKGQHLRRASNLNRIFVGDGLSDICPALNADVVFAKDSLAEYLAERGVPFSPFSSLQPVLQFLETLSAPVVAR